MADLKIVLHEAVDAEKLIEEKKERAVNQINLHQGKAKPISSSSAGID
jgi:hypothetical protein